MKNRTIWVQSCSAESDAAIWSTYQSSVRRHAAAAVGPALSVEFHGLSTTYPGIDYLDSATQLAANEVVRNAIRAEQQGYAAFAFVSTNDAGNREVRELTSLPSAFIAETAVREAMRRGGKFAFLTHNTGSRRKMESLAAERYGLGAALVEGASTELTYHDFAGMYREPAPYLSQLERAAGAAVARGAAVLIPAGGPLNMFFVDHGIRQIGGVPLLDIHAVVLQAAVQSVGADAPPPASPPTSEQKEKLRNLFLQQGGNP